jgi:sRNA-binding regulator protein Hfq
MSITDSLMNQELSEFKDSQAEIAIYLQNGIRLTGKIVEFDDGSIKITGKSVPVIIERGSIATVQPFVREERGNSGGGGIESQNGRRS